MFKKKKFNTTNYLDGDVDATNKHIREVIHKNIAKIAKEILGPSKDNWELHNSKDCIMFNSKHNITSIIIENRTEYIDSKIQFIGVFKLTINKVSPIFVKRPIINSDEDTIAFIRNSIIAGIEAGNLYVNQLKIIMSNVLNNLDINGLADSKEYNMYPFYYAN